MRLIDRLGGFAGLGLNLFFLRGVTRRVNERRAVDAYWLAIDKQIAAGNAMGRGENPRLAGGRRLGRLFERQADDELPVFSRDLHLGSPMGVVMFGLG